MALAAVPLKIARRVFARSEPLEARVEAFVAWLDTELPEPVSPRQRRMLRWLLQHETPVIPLAAIFETQALIDLQHPFRSTSPRLVLDANLELEFIWRFAPMRSRRASRMFVAVNDYLELVGVLRRPRTPEQRQDLEAERARYAELLGPLQEPPVADFERMALFLKRTWNYQRAAVLRFDRAQRLFLAAYGVAWETADAEGRAPTLGSLGSPPAFAPALGGSRLPA